MSATTVARGVRDVPRQRHLSVVPAEGFGGSAAPGPGALGPAALGSGAARSDGGLRLTRRGRVLVALVGWCAIAVVLGLVVVAAGLLLGGESDAQGGSGSPVRATEHVVLPGETLWQIASDWAPGEDPREAITRLVEFNALPGVQILAGQTLMLPEQP